MKFARALLVVGVVMLGPFGIASAESTANTQTAGATTAPFLSAFAQTYFGKDTGLQSQLFDDYVRIYSRLGTVDMRGEAEQKYLTKAAGDDPVLTQYLAAVKSRSGTVKTYKGLLNPKLFKFAGITEAWPGSSKMTGEDNPYLEFDQNGRLQSILMRRAVFTSGSLGIGVYREHIILDGALARSIENRVSNKDLEAAFLRDAVI